MRTFGSILALLLLASSCDRPKPEDHYRIVEQEEVKAGLVEGEGMMLVKTNCTGCHSELMITQNRATREGWLSMIRWMQANQNLWDLGENEAAILDYLEANYSPEKKGRRSNLAEIEWYELNE